MLAVGSEPAWWVNWAVSAAFYFGADYGDPHWQEQVARGGCAVAQLVSRCSIVWKDVSQQEQYGHPAPEATRGGICPLANFFFFFLSW